MRPSLFIQINLADLDCSINKSLYVILSLHQSTGTDLSALPDNPNAPLHLAMTYRRKFDNGKGSKSAAKPDNLHDPVFNLGEFPVQVKNIERFMYIYDESRSEYQGHTIHNYDSGDGKKIDVTIPPEMISKMFAEIMSTEHPVLFHMMLRSDYRNRDRPNKIGKLIPKTMVLFNNKATQFGFNRLAQNISYHGCQLMTKNNVQPFKENRPGCVDTLYCVEMIDNLHGEVKTKKQSKSSSRSKPKYGKLGGGSMLLEDSEERKQLKSVMCPFEELAGPAPCQTSSSVT